MRDQPRRLLGRIVAVLGHKHSDLADAAVSFGGARRRVGRRSANAAGSISLTRCPARSSCSRKPGSRIGARSRSARSQGSARRDRLQSAESLARRSLGARPQNTEFGHGPPATASGTGRIEPGDRELAAPLLAGAQRRTRRRSLAPLPPFGIAAEDQIPQRVRLRLDGEQQPARGQQIAQARPAPPVSSCSRAQACTARMMSNRLSPRSSAGSRGDQQPALAPGDAGNDEAEPRGLLGDRGWSRHSGTPRRIAPADRAPGGSRRRRRRFRAPATAAPPASVRRSRRAPSQIRSMPGGADRRAVQQMLDHRQRRGCRAWRRPSASRRGQLLGRGRDQREFGNQFRLLRQAAGARLRRLRAGRCRRRSARPDRPPMPRRTAPAGRAGSRTAAPASGAIAPFVDDLVDRERHVGIDDAQQRLAAPPRRSARPAAELLFALARRSSAREWRRAARRSRRSAASTAGAAVLGQRRRHQIDAQARVLGRRRGGSARPGGTSNPTARATIAPASSNSAISADAERVPIRVTRNRALCGTRPNGADDAHPPEAPRQKTHAESRSSACRSAISASSACSAPSSSAGWIRYRRRAVSSIDRRHRDAPAASSGAEQLDPAHGAEPAP